MAFYTLIWNTSHCLLRVKTAKHSSWSKRNKRIYSEPDISGQCPETHMEVTLNVIALSSMEDTTWMFIIQNKKSYINAFTQYIGGDIRYTVTKEKRNLFQRTQVWVWGWWELVVQLREHMPTVLPDSTNSNRSDTEIGHYFFFLRGRS